jgi:hypothetical protein
MAVLRQTGVIGERAGQGYVDDIMRERKGRMDRKRHHGPFPLKRALLEPRIIRAAIRSRDVEIRMNPTNGGEGGTRTPDPAIMSRVL